MRSRYRTALVIVWGKSSELVAKPSIRGILNSFAKVRALPHATPSASFLGYLRLSLTQCMFLQVYL